jgi:5'-3' exonuclease
VAKNKRPRRKAAAALVREHGGVEPLLNNLDAVKSARSREKLSAAREQILQNRKMVELDCHPDLPLPLDELRIFTVHRKLPAGRSQEGARSRHSEETRNAPVSRVLLSKTP